VPPDLQVLHVTEGQGPDYAVHDFPNAAYGIKLGGFMVRGGHQQAKEQKARYLD